MQEVPPEEYPPGLVPIQPLDGLRQKIGLLGSRAAYDPAPADHLPDEPAPAVEHLVEQLLPHALIGAGGFEPVSAVVAFPYLLLNEGGPILGVCLGDAPIPMDEGPGVIISRKVEPQLVLRHQVHGAPMGPYLHESREGVGLPVIRGPNLQRRFGIVGELGLQAHQVGHHSVRIRFVQQI